MQLGSRVVNSQRPVTSLHRIHSLYLAFVNISCIYSLGSHLSQLLHVLAFPPSMLTRATRQLAEHFLEWNQESID